MTMQLDAVDRTAHQTSDRLRIVATASLVLSGISLAAYALTAFTTRDWTVAGPGLLVAAAGVAGLRNRWFHLAGLVPMGAILSIAGPILAYDLARPDETPYFIGTVAIIVGGCLAAVFGTASALTTSRRGLPVSALAAVAVTPIVFAVVIGGSPASATADDDITDDERTSAVDIEMVDYAYAVDPSLLDDGRVVHLRNTGTLPHDFTIATLDVAVFVPPGRDTYLRLPDPLTKGFVVVCTIGDHLERGMRIDVARNGP